MFFSLSCEPVPAQASQATLRRHAQLHLRAGEGLSDEVDLHAGPHIGPAALTPAAATAAHELAKHLVVGRHPGRGPAGAEALRAAAVLEGRMAETVVRPAFLVVLQHLVGFAAFLETRFRLCVPRIAIGMGTGGLATLR